MFIPASFAPMVLKLIMPKINDHLIKVFKLEKVLQYVELPNEADIRLDKLEAQIKMLAKDQHPPAIDLDKWEEVKEVVGKVKKMRAYKSLGK